MWPMNLGSYVYILATVQKSSWLAVILPFSKLSYVEVFTFNDSLLVGVLAAGVTSISLTDSFTLSMCLRD